MLLGVDTGFFVSYANHHPRALTLWQELIDGLHTLVVSTLTINEILVCFYQRGESDKGQEWVALMIETDSIEVVPVSVEIAARSARYCHGMGLPTVDSVILATFLERGCEEMLSTDDDFRIVDEQKVLPVEFLI
ncbi:MAG: type II toxin-antitoxin system VapC family toxin [Deltaproteobacteria bacterium]|nr:type II toxin-antitoxin system VapC family toxin [Deltaproteobacteria bacterium]